MKLDNYYRLMGVLTDDGAGGDDGGSADINTDGDTGTVELPEGKEWLQGVEPELATDPSLQAIQDIPTLVKSYVHAQKMVGRDKVVVPDENASDEDWKAFYNKVGLPTSLEEYEVEVPEDIELDPEVMENLKQMAFENNITPKQLQKIIEHEQDIIRVQMEKEAALDEQYKEEGIQQLIEEWGEEGFQKNINRARTVLEEFGDEEFDQYLDETGLADDPMMIKFLASVGSNLTEDNFTADSVAHLGVSKDDAQAEVDKMLGDSNHPYWNANHANHNQAVKRMMKLQEILAK